jgi:hypothetical protein
MAVYRRSWLAKTREMLDALNAVLQQVPRYFHRVE